VFLGRVLGIDKGDYGSIVNFQVEQVWKGTLDQNELIHTAGSDAACGYYFEQGKEYVVYGYGQDSINVSSCSLTSPFVDSYATLSALGPGYLPNESKPADRSYADVIAVIAVAGIGIFAARQIFMHRKRIVDLISKYFNRPQN